MAEEAEDLDLEHEAEPEVAPEGVETPKDFDVEGVARLAGWAPKDQWRGDPADWKDADAFLIDTAAINKDLRKNVKELRSTVEKTARVAETIIERERKTALETARAELRQAVQSGDEEAADRAAERIQRAAEPAKQASSADEFAADHAWFGIHAEATGLAQVAAEKAFRAGKDTQQQFAAAEAAVRTKFPYLFDDEPAQRQETRQEERRQPAQVQGGQRTTRERRDPVAALSPEARKAGEHFVRMSKGKMTLADYAKLYNEENA
jgi:hypothetical protein